ncbi:MAG: hypothetical protein RL708_582 [Bacteroidota bacterium]|jgi:predicted nuclease of predicted toxin-antitoxin system
MKFLVDAQLPEIIAEYIINKGFDAIHTNDLPNKHFTTDNEIRNIALEQNRIIITKDSDFLDSYYIKQQPKKLLLISTGNIRNKQLLTMFENNFEKLIELFQSHSFVEMDNLEIIGHE